MAGAVATLGEPVTPRFFFFNDPAAAEIHPVSLHDALPIFQSRSQPAAILVRFRPVNSLVAGAVATPTDPVTPC